ncbi:MAG: cysteine hydrolase [Candidatus Aminicenantes bacterium]|nr:cysteine hydrolase [Candidatus Aminicenantes bacterium]
MNEKDTALIIIDVQYFYFPGGALSLNNPEQTAENIKKILTKFRSEKKTVIHIRHNSKKGGEIYKLLTPLKNEKVISKNFANSFKDTDLLSHLKKNGISRLVVTGMQTHMCVEAAVRAAADYGFKCIVISDGCTTRDLKFNGKITEAGDVHNSTLSTLSGTYAEITDTANYLKNKLDTSIQQ